jgi:serine/threonine-protein kinase
VVFDEVDSKSLFDVRILSIDGETESTPVLQTSFNEQNADISPDGRWLAYQSDESGRTEVYVRPFPDVAAGRWLVSSGSRPLWARNGRELFYLDIERRLTVVPVQAGGGFSVGAATTLFDTRPFGVAGIGRNFDVAPDGTRFLMVKELPTPTDAKRLIIVEHWFEELKRIVATK